MQRKNFLFCGPSLETRRETVEFPFELLPPSRRKEAKSEGDVDKSEKSEEDEKESESENSYSKERRHLVYISMGTLYRMNPLFFRTCFAAFKNSPHLFVMSVGKGNLENVGETPDNFIVKEYVPQPQILDRASVFISHGGMGGISEAMVSNVPMVLLPKTIEQQMNARRIEELGAGVNLGCQAEDITADRLRLAVDRLLDPKVSAAYVEATQRVSRSFDETGGAKAAVEAIDKMMEALAIAQAHSMPSIWARLRHTNSASALPLTARLSWERKAEATEFVHNFAYVLDSSNRTAAAEFFVHNGSFNGARGGDAIKEYMHSSLPTPLAQRHVFSNVLVTARDDTHLHVKALVQAYHEQGTVCVQDYTADLVRNDQNNGWLFESVVMVPFTTVAAARPTTPRSGKKSSPRVPTKTTPKEKRRNDHKGKERRESDSACSDASDVSELGGSDDAYQLKLRNLEASEREAKEEEDPRSARRKGSAL